MSLQQDSDWYMLYTTLLHSSLHCSIFPEFSISDSLKNIGPKYQQQPRIEEVVIKKVDKQNNVVLGQIITIKLKITYASQPQSSPNESVPHLFKII